MGAFNTLKFDWTNKLSNKKYNLILQFKYAKTWQYEYKIGDTLKWGDNRYDEGDKSAKEVLVIAIVENDNLLNEVPEDFEILIKNNVIADAFPLRDKKKYLEIEENYIILKK